jgi:hypothetical protein
LSHNARAVAKTLQGKRLVVRVPAPLRDDLEAAAQRDSRPLSSLVRKVLAEFVVANQRPAADQPSGQGRQ